MSWLPYPENIPKTDKEYLITLNKQVTISEFQINTKLYDEHGIKYYGPAWHDLIEGGIHNNVVAFMEKPSPYQF